MPLSTQFVKLKVGNSIYCIKDFPDIDPRGEIDQVEITDLCDEYHKYIDGLKNYADNLEFTANYDETIFSRINGISEYDPSQTYSTSASIIVKHEGVFYKRTGTGNTTGTWDSTKWIEATVELLLCNSSSDITGKNGKFTIAHIKDIYLRLVGAGVGDVLEMVWVIKPHSAITFSTVA